MLPSCLLHNVMQYFLRRAVATESQIKQKELVVFLVIIPLHLFQLPIATTPLNAIRLHVSVLGSHSNFMYISEYYYYVYSLASGMLYD